MFIPVPHYSNLETEFISIDDEARLKANLERLPNTWRWHNEKIIYKTNRYGYRTVNPEDIQWDNYFLSLGDSQVFGTGLSEEVLFTTLISKETGSQGINMGMPACSPEFVFDNLITFLTHAVKKPKFVLLAWPNLVRRTWFLQDEVYPWLPQHSHRDKKYKKLDDVSVELSQFSKHIATTWNYQRAAAKLICESAGIKYIDNFSFIIESFEEHQTGEDMLDIFSLEPYYDSTHAGGIEAINEYWARDWTPELDCHVGPILHRAVAKWILNKL